MPCKEEIRKIVSTIREHGLIKIINKMNGYGTETLTVLMPCRVVKNKDLLYIWIMLMCQSFFFYSLKVVSLKNNISDNQTGWAMKSVSSDIQSPRNDINYFKTRGGVFISHSNTEKKINKTKRMRVFAFKKGKITSLPAKSIVFNWLSDKIDLSMLHRTLIFVKMVKFLIVKAIEICNNICFTFL